MPSKNFEHTFPFATEQRDGQLVSFPTIPVGLYTPAGARTEVPFLVDTGASTSILRADFAALVGVTDVRAGTKRKMGRVGTRAVHTVYVHLARVEVLGRVIENCPLVLDELPEDPLFVGLLGRNPIYTYFGFGFWERVRELYVAVAP